MNRLFSNEVKESITYKWVQKVLDSLEDSVPEAEADVLIGYHPDMDFEFFRKGFNERGLN